MVGKALEIKFLHIVLNAQVVTTPPHVPQYESFFMNIAEEFVICGKVSFWRKRFLAYKHGNFMAINNCTWTLFTHYLKNKINTAFTLLYPRRKDFVHQRTCTPISCSIAFGVAGWTTTMEVLDQYGNISKTILTKHFFDSLLLFLLYCILKVINVEFFAKKSFCVYFF